MVTIQKYIRPQSLEEAYQLNQNKRNRIVGGMLWMKTGTQAINTAIDLCDLGLNQIEETEDAFSIGAMVTLRQLEQHPAFGQYTNGAVKAAVKDIIGVQFRNLATVGGSIWGRFGFSDVLTIFLAMDSYVELFHGGVIPLEQFAAMRYDNDLLVRIIVKKVPGRFVYQAMRIQHTDFPVLTCAVSRVNGSYRAVIGARPGRARVVHDEAGLLASGVGEAQAKAFADLVAERIPTESNVRGSAAYRTHLIRVLTQRSLLELGGL